MDPLVLGLNSLHADSSAVLMNKHGMVAAICEERINRKALLGLPEAGDPGGAADRGASIRDVTDLAFAATRSRTKGRETGVHRRRTRVWASTSRRIRFGREPRTVGRAVQMGVNEADCRFNTHTSSTTWRTSPVRTSVSELREGGGGVDRRLGRLVLGDDRQVRGARDPDPAPHAPAHSLGIFWHGDVRVHRVQQVRGGVQGDGAGGLRAAGVPSSSCKLVTWDPEKGVMDTDVFTSYSEIRTRRRAASATWSTARS